MKVKNIRIKESEIGWINKNLSKNIGIADRVRLTEKEYNKLVKYREESNKDTLSKKEQKEFEDFKDLSKSRGMFEVYKIPKSKSGKGRETTAVLQWSDQHVGEVVLKESVLGKNEYNQKVALERNTKVFELATKFIQHHQEHYNINRVIVAVLGDSIGGWIHDELMQTNSMTPNEEIMFAKSLFVAGIKYMREMLDVENIDVVCICGNHSRETKKIHFGNFTTTSKEYFMYLDVQDIVCNHLKLKGVTFYIPNSAMTVLEIYGKNYLFAHGHQFNFAGGIGGIFPPMMRWFAKMNETIKGLEAAFIGHYHTSIFYRVIVNGSPKGWDDYAMGKGISYEPPTQNLTLIDSEHGICNFQKINLQ